MRDDFADWTTRLRWKKVAVMQCQKESQIDTVHTHFKLAVTSSAENVFKIDCKWTSAVEQIVSIIADRIQLARTRGEEMRTEAVGEFSSQHYQQKTG